MPKISVIMGLYNAEATLKEALDSLFSQTFQDFELIMCDDGSQDSTLFLAQEYAVNHPHRIVLLQNSQNMGLNHTLNRCLAHANGAYIARMDADDISLPQRFAQEAAFLDHHPEFAFVSTSMTFFDETGVFGLWKNPEIPQRLDFFRSSPCFCHGPCMLRREALLAVGGYSAEPRFLRCEDINLWYKLFEAGYQGYNFQQPLYQMRDDRKAFKRRTFQNRMNIIRTEFDGMGRLKCRGLEYRFFARKAARQFLLALIPESLYQRLHRFRLHQYPPAGKEAIHADSFSHPHSGPGWR